MKVETFVTAFFFVVYRFGAWATADQTKSLRASSVQHHHNNGNDSQNKPLSIVEYVNSHVVAAHQFILLKWDKDGKLELERMNTTLSVNQMIHWFGPDAQDLFTEIGEKPSPYGTVALLLNSDHSLAVNWDLEPPVPILTYTAPAHVSDYNNVWIIPNPYDRGDFNRWCIISVQKVAIDFAARKNKVIWRGNIHSLQDEKSRVRLMEVATVEKEKHTHWLDAKCTSDESGDHDELSMEDMVQYKYQLDVGGLSGTSWGGLRWKMCSGSLVFKVDTWSKDWWHDKIHPWQDYIPVKADLSDLEVMWQWAEDNPEKAAAIAKAGRKACDFTSFKCYVNNYLENTIRSLPHSTEERVQEADAILDGITPF